MSLECKNIIFRMEMFREGDLIVSICPELNVSSFGDTIDDAKNSLKEAISLFLEECERMGTLDDILEECGFLCIYKKEISNLKARPRYQIYNGL